jgi:hypothetical protein
MDKHLSEFRRLLDIIHDRTRAVALRYHTGFYLTGRGGTSKTWTVEETLKRIGVPWIYKNARMSAMGLWKTLASHPEHVVVLDDIAPLFQEKGALAILLAALGGQPGKPRIVTYTTLDKDHAFEFVGGVVAISNLPLKRDPIADALASRVLTYEHDPSDEMIQAFMLASAGRGYKDLNSDECIDVVEFIIEECRRSDYRLDLRFMTKGWEDRRLEKHGESRCSWQDLVKSSLKRVYASEMTSPAGGSRADKVTWKAKVAADLFAKYPDDRANREEEWSAITGESRASLYRSHRRSVE